MGLWGDGSKWGDGSLWAEQPLPYPRVNHVRLEIRTASGSNYTDKAYDDSYRIVESGIPRLHFTFRQDGISDIDDHDEIILLGEDQGRLFAGFVETISAERSDGPFFEYDIVGIGYGWLLDHPNDKITKVYEDNTADSTIIADVMTYIPEIDAATHVDTIETFAGKMYFENQTPRQILDAICKRTGGEYYVDFGPADEYKAYLHYYAPGSKDAPYELRDLESGTQAYPYYPYDNLRKRTEHGVATKVIVEGQPTFVEVTEKGWGDGLADGTKTRFELPYKMRPLNGEIRPLIWVTDGAGGYDWQKVGYGNSQDSLGDIDSGGFEVLWYNDDKYLEFNTAPPSYPGGDAFEYSAYERRPTEGTATDAAGLAKYGRHLVRRVHDERILDTATAQLAAEALLVKWKSSIETYTCTSYEHGLHRGQVIALTNANRSLSAEELLIQKLTARSLGGGIWAYDLVLGQYIPSVIEVIRDITAGKRDRGEHEKSSGKPPIIGQIMFNIAGTISATNDTAAIYICAVNNLQILSTQSYAMTGPVGSNMVFKAYRYFSDPAHAKYGTWWSIYTIDEEPYIEDGKPIGVDGTLSTLAGRPWLREGDMIKVVVGSWGSTTAGADVTVSLKVRQ